MCGIAGFWNAEGSLPGARARLEAMTQTLHHRGPDGYGYHVDERNGLAMGHARLSIIDLETGKQPLYDDRERVLTVNGEFYDYKRIRTGLRLEGFRFRTRSDSEIALPLFEKFGMRFVESLRGEFAFVLHDRPNDRLLLVRDRFGIKPLFYWIGDGTLVWGSEAKAVLAHPDVPARLDPRAVLHQLMHTLVPGMSAFEGVRAVLPGHILVVQRHGAGFDVSERRYWDLDFPREHDRDLARSDDFHVRRTREALMEAVAFRLEADVPVGCYLSGGIDSCSMLALASSMQQSPVKAFTIAFDDKDYDESAIAREMAGMTQADQEQINLGADDLYGTNYVRTLWHAERTFYNTLGVAKRCMSERVKDCGYRVVVTGEGSDELFGGYPFFKRDMFLHGSGGAQGPGRDDVRRYRQRMEESNRLFRGAILSEIEVAHPAFNALCGFTPAWLQPWLQTLAMARPLLHDDMLHALKDYDPVAALADALDPDRIEGRHALDKAQYTWSKTMLECQILNWGGDRVDMANSMESRPAFLDHHVAAMALDIPPHLRIRGNVEKWVLREAMRNMLPRVLYEREKFAFMSPPAHTADRKRKAFRALIDRYLDIDSVASAGLFDPDRLAGFVEGYAEDRDPVSLTRKDALMNHIVGLQVLHDLFIRPSRETAARTPAASSSLG